MSIRPMIGSSIVLRVNFPSTPHIPPILLCLILSSSFFPRLLLSLQFPLHFASYSFQINLFFNPLLHLLAPVNSSSLCHSTPFLLPVFSSQHLSAPIPTRFPATQLPSSSPTSLYNFFASPSFFSFSAVFFTAPFVRWLMLELLDVEMLRKCVAVMECRLILKKRETQAEQDWRVGKGGRNLLRTGSGR